MKDDTYLMIFTIVIFGVLLFVLFGCEAKPPSEVLVQTKMDCFTYSLKAIDTEYHPGQRIPALCDQA